MVENAALAVGSWSDINPARPVITELSCPICYKFNLCQHPLSPSGHLLQ